MKYLARNKHWEIDKEYNIDKILYLLADRPDFVSEFNEYCWKNNKNQIHRDYDLPTRVDNDEVDSVVWYTNYRKHRENNKPAKIWFDGEKEYWLDNKRYFV